MTMGQLGWIILVCSIVMLGWCAYILYLIHRWYKNRKEKEDYRNGK